MGINSTAHSLRATFKAGASAKTTTSQYRIAALDYTTTDYGSAYISTKTCGAANAVIGVIDSYQTGNSETVEVITYGVAQVYIAGAAFTTIGAGQLLCMYTAGAVGGVHAGATSTSPWVLGYALGIAQTECVATIFVNPQYRAASTFSA